MNDAELAPVNGPAVFSGALFNYSASVAWNRDMTCRIST
jgi:hypothetical protein